MLEGGKQVQGVAGQEVEGLGRAGWRWARKVAIRAATWSSRAWGDGLITALVLVAGTRVVVWEGASSAVIVGVDGGQYRFGLLPLDYGFGACVQAG